MLPLLLDRSGLMKLTLSFVSSRPFIFKVELFKVGLEPTCPTRWGLFALARLYVAHQPGIYTEQGDEIVALRLMMGSVLLLPLPDDMT